MHNEMNEGINLMNQNLFDHSIQNTGSIENVFEIAKANDVSITDLLDIGTAVKIESKVDVGLVKSHFKANEVQPATADPNIEDIELIKEGIGHWFIGRDFKVS